MRRAQACSIVHQPLVKDGPQDPALVLSSSHINMEFSLSIARALVYVATSHAHMSVYVQRRVQLAALCAAIQRRFGSCVPSVRSSDVLSAGDH